ncbi:B12 binding domain-containing protein [Microlunatus sagamiharensis]|uniref:B12 binding domain-containing protein n=1 Tax=Microlunatus sagamiharensis TaxID=546874 RepID=A0A1H2MQT9_9ACTN|nr:B12-binding domain-containing protein [Microlunatus sagamiharensis]SDU95281.1 B12 binding domain-containing protein [Microlunatus sagamiharensis]
MHVDPAPATYVGTILTAVRSFNQNRVCAALDDADATLGLDTTIDEIVFPALRVVGTFWSSGTLDVAHEHVLSSAMTRWVAARSSVLPAPSRRGTILLAAGPEDLHTLALDCLDLLLVSRGVEVCNLGAQTPVASLLVALRSVHPSAVVVCSHTPTVASPAVRSVRAISDAGVPVYFAGSSFSSQFFRQNSPGVPLDGTLRESADVITSRHTTPPPEPSVLPREHFRQRAAASA